MNVITIRGAAGEVRWSYHTAVTLKDWTVAAASTGGTLTAKVVSHDPFKASQQPLTFVVPRPSGRRWAWPIESLQVTGTVVSARLGPQEE